MRFQHELNAAKRVPKTNTKKCMQIPDNGSPLYLVGCGLVFGVWFRGRCLFGASFARCPIGFTLQHLYSFRSVSHSSLCYSCRRGLNVPGSLPYEEKIAFSFTGAWSANREPEILILGASEGELCSNMCKWRLQICRFWSCGNGLHGTGLLYPDWCNLFWVCVVSFGPFGVLSSACGWCLCWPAAPEGLTSLFSPPLAL